MAVWAMAEPRTAPVFLLDEPSKFLSVDLQPKFGQMLRELSDLLGVQFVVVTHSPEVAESADRAYNVDKDGAASAVKLV
jgi:ABC-type glutathione transport system ATPase component